MQAEVSVGVGAAVWVGNQVVKDLLVNVNIENEVFVRRLAVIIEFLDDWVEISI